MQVQRLSHHIPDWGSFVVAVIMFISPWMFHYTSAMATLATCFSAALLVVLSTLAIAEVDETEEPEYFILGAWLLISPWILGFWWDKSALAVHVVFGALLIIHAVWVIWVARPSEPNRGL